MMSFKSVYDALTKSKLLVGIYVDIGAMNRKCKHIFLESVDCLVCDKDELAKEISDEDKVINEYEVKVRTDILKYLAINRAPDLGAALVMTSVVIDYERIGDYCKGIAGLGLRFPAQLDDENYLKIIDPMKETIIKQFDLAYEAVKSSDIKRAKKAIKGYNGIKTYHDGLNTKLNKDQEIDKNRAIVLASLGIYYRRISAHLSNVCTTVVNPFPYVGFSKKLRK